MTTINLDPRMAHKTIKVRARSCSECGNKSEWIEKRFYVGCHFAQLSFLPNKKVFSKVEKCQKIIYTVDGSEPTLENCLFYNDDDGLLVPANGGTVKARLVCTETNKMSEIVTLSESGGANIFVLGFGDKVLGFGDKVLGMIGE